MQNSLPRLSAETIKQQLSPIDFYQSEIDLETNRNHGWVDGGLCPFHDDSRTGTFRVNLGFGGFTCFSCDAKGGDIIAFLILRDDLTFIEALRYLHDHYEVG